MSSMKSGFSSKNSSWISSFCIIFTMSYNVVLFMYFTRRFLLFFVIKTLDLSVNWICLNKSSIRKENKNARTTRHFAEGNWSLFLHEFDLRSSFQSASTSGDWKLFSVGGKMCVFAYVFLVVYMYIHYMAITILQILRVLYFIKKYSIPWLNVQIKYQ